MGRDESSVSSPLAGLAVPLCSARGPAQAQAGAGTEQPSRVAAVAAGPRWLPRQGGREVGGAFQMGDLGQCGCRRPGFGRAPLRCQPRLAGLCGLPALRTLARWQDPCMPRASKEEGERRGRPGGPRPRSSQGHRGGWGQEPLSGTSEQPGPAAGRGGRGRSWAAQRAGLHWTVRLNLGRASANQEGLLPS